jgi:hypothetical protein
MFKLKPWHQKGLLIFFGLFALHRGYTWVQTITKVEAAEPPQIAASVPLQGDAAVDAAIAAMRQGLTELRQAATTGEPAMLQEAERDILKGLLDGLDASGVDPARYQRMADAVAEVEGMFKYIPYRLEVQPGHGLPPIVLMLRRSPWPMIQARRSSAWQAAIVEGGVRLTPKTNP